jgi:hypothetical protein
MAFEESIFIECNSHLKETDKKRDQIVALYFVVFSLLATNFHRLNEKFEDYVLLSFSLFGLLILVATIHYRKWHIIYVRSSQAISLFMLTDDMDFESRIRFIEGEFEKSSYMSSWKEWLNPFRSTEATIFFFFILATFAPVYFFLWKNELMIFLDMIFIPFAILLVFYYFICIGLGYILLRPALQNSIFDTWILLPIKIAYSK